MQILALPWRAIGHGNGENAGKHGKSIYLGFASKHWTKHAFSTWAYFSPRDVLPPTELAQNHKVDSFLTPSYFNL